MDGITDWSMLRRYEYLTTGLDPSESAEADLYPTARSQPTLPSSNTAPADNVAYMSAQLGLKTTQRQRYQYHPIRPVLWSLTGCLNINGMRATCLPSIQSNTLTFLDLSFTNNSTTWYQSFSGLPLHHLRILKLRGLRLTDSYLPRFELRRGYNLWSLDLRDNFLTDATINSLAGWFYPTLPLQFRQTSVGLYQLPPQYGRDQDLLQDGTDGTVAFRSDSKDDFLRHMALHSHTANMPDADPLFKHTGLTHLYLSNNKFTSTGIRKLLANTNRLHVLDVGTVRDTDDTQFKSRHAISWDQVKGASSLIIANSYHLSSLRIHHSIMTCMPTVTVASANNEGARSPTSYSLQHLEAAEELGQSRILNKIITFAPMKNCVIESLTLTGIPTKSYGYLVEKLIEFLDACRKQEEELSNARLTTHRRAPQVLPGLKTLRLEFLPPDTLESTRSAARGSISGDADAEAFSAASNEDFSFFSEDIEPPMRRLTLGSRGNSDVGQSTDTKEKPLKDVVEELKRARREAGGNKWGGDLELLLPQVGV